MSNKNNLTAEALWQKITAIKTIQEWMELTDGFSLYTIYHHCRILQDPAKIETYHCLISINYPLSLEAYDTKDPSARCYMMMGNGIMRQSCNPTFFDLLINESVRSAHNDGPYTAEDLSAEPETKADDTPGVVVIAAVIELLKQLKVDAAHYDKSKQIAIIVMITGIKESYVRRKIYEGFTLTERHQPSITRINQFFKDVNLPIVLKVGNSY